MSNPSKPTILCVDDDSGLRDWFEVVLGDHADKVRAFQVGAADYLVKPLDEKALLQMVDLHLGTSKRWKNLSAAQAPDRTPETKIETAGPPRWDARPSTRRE